MAVEANLVLALPRARSVRKGSWEQTFITTPRGLLLIARSILFFKTSSNQRCMRSAVSSGAVVCIGGGCVHRCSK